MPLIHHLQRLPAELCLWGDGRIEELGRGFRASAAEPQLATYLWAIAVPTAACLLGWVVHRWANRSPRISHSLPALTHDLYRLHRIRLRHRRLLEEVAHASEIAEPAMLLVVPEVFDRATATARQRLQLKPREHAALDALRRRLFGGIVSESR